MRPESGAALNPGVAQLARELDVVFAVHAKDRLAVAAWSSLDMRAASGISALITNAVNAAVKTR